MEGNVLTPSQKQALKEDEGPDELKGHVKYQEEDTVKTSRLL
ncbi:MAG: hypothetical protein QXY52_02120 [Conexivisphaerales archaeon]